MYRICEPKYISEFEILPPTIYSNHSQVLFNLKYKYIPVVKYMTRQSIVNKKRVWEEEKALEFKNELKHLEKEFIYVFETDIDLMCWRCWPYKVSEP